MNRPVVWLVRELLDADDDGYRVLSVHLTKEGAQGSRETQKSIHPQLDIDLFCTRLDA